MVYEGGAVVGTGLLGQLVGYAALDSINPCTFYVYAVLLLATSIRYKSPRKIMATALSFTLAVYFGYLVIGLGIAFSALVLPLWLLGLVAIVFGAYNVAEAVAEKRGKRLPLARPGGRLASPATRAAGSIVAAALLGLLASFTLLPCSSGPLLAFIVAARASGVASLAAILPYLLVYNVVFVSPLLAIGLSIAAAYRARRVQELVARYAPELSLIAGLLLIAIGVYVLHEAGII